LGAPLFFVNSPERRKKGKKKGRRGTFDAKLSGSRKKKGGRNGEGKGKGRGEVPSILFNCTLRKKKGKKKRGGKGEKKKGTVTRVM